MEEMLDQLHRKWVLPFWEAIRPEITAALQNCLDPAVPADKPRKVIITLALTPDDLRESVSAVCSADSKTIPKPGPAARLRVPSALMEGTGEGGA